MTTKKHYYGQRASRIPPKEDLGIKYFSSSKDKAFIEDQKSNPQNYKYKIVKTCVSAQQAISFEVKLHAKFNVSINPNFYNAANQTSSKFTTFNKVTVKDKDGNFLQVTAGEFESNNELVGVNKGFNHTVSTKKRISDAHKGKTFTEQHRQNLSKARKGKNIAVSANSLKALEDNRWKLKTPEVRSKISAANKGRILTKEHKQKIGKAQKGVSKPCKLTPEQREALGKKIGKLATIYNATTDQIIADDVIIGRWAKENSYDRSQLSRTTRRDLTQPKSKENVHSYKNMYAVYKEEND